MTDPSTNVRHEIRSSEQKPLQSSAAFIAASTPCSTDLRSVKSEPASLTTMAAVVRWLQGLRPLADCPLY
jgi:hypothetical protein